MASPFPPTASGWPAPAATRPRKVFDLEKKESLVTFPGHAQPVYTVSFTPDGKGVATGGEDNRIRIWNPDNDAKSIREIGGFGGTVFKLRYSPDGKNLLAVGGDKTVHVFDAKGSQLRKLQGHNDWIYALAVSPDSKTVASGSWDGEVKLWNLADGKLLKTIIAAPGYKPAAPRRRRSDSDDAARSNPNDVHDESVLGSRRRSRPADSDSPSGRLRTGSRRSPGCDRSWPAGPGA